MANILEDLDFTEIANLRLFTGIEKDELPKMLQCLNTIVCSYPKGAYIISPGEPVKRFGVVLKGRVLVLSEESDGTRSILTDKQKDELFGTDVALNEANDNISIVAAGDCRVLLFEVNRVFWNCTVPCNTHKQLLYNLVQLLSNSNTRLIHKFRHVSQHSLRKKIQSFFLEQSEIQGKCDFEIAFNRQELADYLVADRSALSAELSRMRKEGLIDFRKNHFILKETFFRAS